jgi:galactokinase
MNASMTSTALFFQKLGMTAADAASRAELFAKLDVAAPAILDGAPESHRFTPGRIEIFGKHTDYAGGHSLLATVPRGIAMASRKRSDNIIRVGDIFDGQVIEIDPSIDTPPHYHGLQRYVSVIAHRLTVNFPGCELGVNIAIASDLPRASGMSSSSALSVGVALALIDRARLREREEWQRHLRRIDDLAWYLGSVENGDDFPGLPGSSGVGIRGGSEDQTAILACKTDHVSLYRFQPVTPLDEQRMPSDWMFVIASSGIQADKADSVKDRYNRASFGARALLAIWNHNAPVKAPSLADALHSSRDACQRLKGWLKPTADGAFTVEDLSRRLDHFVRETARAPIALIAFRDADRHALGQLAADSQRDADVLLGNQIPETIAMAKLARELGAFASSNFGAGFGGSVWAAVAAPDAKRFGEEWVRAYAKQFPHLGEVAWFACRPGPPATELIV